MATWKLSPQYKKSAVEKMFFYKDGKVIIIEQGFRWATFTVESDERPLTDLELKNDDGYELGCIDNDESWEMCEMTDGCWLDISIGNDKTTSTDEEEFTEAWEEDSYEAVEALGWSQDDTEYYYHGPLELTNEDTGEVFQGEPNEPQEKTEEQLVAELDELIATMPEIHVSNTDDPVDFPVTTKENSGVTDWFPNTVDPVRIGTYEVINEDSSAVWPFPYSVTLTNWDGKKWNSKVQQWRGLDYDPSQ
jgi:hypothetical protein